MAADEAWHARWTRGRRLSALLAAVAMTCWLAFWWVALRPVAPPFAQGETAVSRSHQPPASSALAAGANAPAGGSPQPVTITVMTLGNELKPEQVADFEALNPDIHVQFFEFSTNLLDILIATQDLPDVFRLGYVEHRPLIAQGLLLDITQHLARSKVIALDQLRRETRDEVCVDGRYYGVPQGLETPDFASLYINTAAFKAAGMTLPSLKQPLTFAELAALARALTAKTGRPAFYSFSFERAVSAVLAQRGTRMFSDDFSQMTLTGTPKALDVIHYYYDLAVSGAMHVAPATPAIAFMFERGELPITQSGYWMGAVLTPQTPVHGRVAMLPPPVWDRSVPRFGSLLGGTKLVIAANSKHPDQAFRFVEWYTAGPPAVERVRKGWGFPLLPSMEPLLPQQSEFDQQRLALAREIMSLPVVQLPVYPYRGILPAFNQSWVKNIALAKAGKIEFDEFASNLQEDVNLAIRDEMTPRHGLGDR